MVITRRSVVALATAAALVSLAACGGGSGSNSGNGSQIATRKGGTVYYLTNRPTEHWDPQRLYVGLDLTDASRLFYRSLVTYPITADPKKAVTPVPDMATDTGKSSNNAKTWSFTLKGGIKWQDGKPVTCADLKYGVSRSFATDVITGGPNYSLGFLDAPHGKSGLPLYDGPYKNDHKGDFDKAVTCSSDNKTITYRFNKPWPDFPLAVASLACFDPYRKDQDQGDKSNYAIFSDGPYKLQGKWDTNKGGTLVRNTQWTQSTDRIRKALPDKFVFQLGLSPEVVNGRLIADSGNDKFAVTDQRIPPSFYSRINGPVAQRATLVDSPYVDYVLPNFNRIKNQMVRQALLLSTDTQGWINAGGGSKAYKHASSIVNPVLIGYQANPAFSTPASGEPDYAGAKKMLQASGQRMPYPIKFTYQGGTPTTDKEAAALKGGWDRAGFKVDLDPLTETYYDVVDKPSADSDVVYGGWGADWPSISTVIPALFDSRVNLTSASNGNDYGNYRSDKVNKMIDQAAAQSSVQGAAKIYAQIDAQLGKDVAYIPLEITRFYYLHGSKVSGFLQGPQSNGYADLGAIGVNG